MRWHWYKPLNSDLLVFLAVFVYSTGLQAAWLFLEMKVLGAHFAFFPSAHLEIGHSQWEVLWERCCLEVSSSSSFPLASHLFSSKKQSKLNDDDRAVVGSCSDRVCWENGPWGEGEGEKEAAIPIFSVLQYCSTDSTFAFKTCWQTKNSGNKSRKFGGGGHFKG